MTQAMMVVTVAALAHAFMPVAAPDELLPQSESRPPVAVPAADVDEGPAPLRVCFNASRSYHPEGKAFVVRWDFGDGRGTTSEPGACHEYIEPGLYAAMLTVTDDRGLEDSRVLVVSVRELP